MSRLYNEKLKSIFLKQYWKKKEEYDLSVGSVENKDNDEFEFRSTFSSSLHLQSLGFDSNCRKQHHTDRYEVADGANATPIYRRGDSFKMRLTFNRTYVPQNDSVFLIVSYGPNASINKGTKYSLPLLPSKPERNTDQWTVWIDEQSERSMIVEMYTPANCLVGVWRFRFAISSVHSREDENIESENIFYVLFNPWCEDDEVYMENEKEREDYLLNDFGNIFQGTHKGPSPKPWVYGQFDFSVLPSIFLLLERSTYPVNRRGSAAILVRALSAVINANDDNGLLIGMWQGNFSDGTNPDEWTGSVGIFDKFISEGGENPVRYAQCWVFGGCLTTACRAIGIPCRTVTCFQSAHDGDQSLTVSYYLDVAGSELKMQNSIWNYHVWNEVWIKRLDLPDMYSGWQAIDATPQEKSRGLFRVGPTPVKAVLNGDMGLNYDVPFVFSEVNADLCYFQQDPSSLGGFKLLKRDTEAIGILIITDSTTEGNYEKLNEYYKYPDGAWERKVYLKAVRQLPRAQSLYEQASSKPLAKTDDVNFSIVPIKSVIFGEQFKVALNIESYSSEARTVEVHNKAHILLYTGTFVTSIRNETMTIILQPKEKKLVSVTVNPEDYMGKMNNASHIKMAITATVQETHQFFTSDDTFEVIKPKLEIRVQDVVQLKTQFLVTFYFKNPFPTELTNCTLTVEAGNLRRPTVLEISDIPRYGAMEKTIELMPRRAGRSVIVALLKSDQETSIRGSAVISVQ